MDWDAYIRRLAALNETAAGKMRDFVQKHGFGDMGALIDYAYALATKYGEGAAALSAAMYDAAEGETSQEKINSLRRENYAEHREEINAQKRAAYAARRERQREDKANYIDITGKW